MLADCDITVSLEAMQATLHLPAVTKGRVNCQQQRLSKLVLMSAHMWNVLLALSSKGFHFFKALIIADSIFDQKKIKVKRDL